MRATTAAFGVVLALFVMFGTFVVSVGQPDGRVYDCRMVEFHPDYPPKVREACREIMRNRIQTESVTWI